MRRLQRKQQIQVNTCLVYHVTNFLQTFLQNFLTALLLAKILSQVFFIVTVGILACEQTLFWGLAHKLQVAKPRGEKEPAMIMQ